MKFGLSRGEKWTKKNSTNIRNGLIQYPKLQIYRCRKVTKTPQYFQTAQNIYPLQYRRQYRSGRLPRSIVKNKRRKPSLACSVSFFQIGEGLLLDRLELVFADAAQRAHPIFGNILERRSCGNTSVRITHGRIVNPFADRATILFHTLILLKKDLFRTNVTSFFGKTKSEIPIPPSAETIAVPNHPNRRPLSTDEARPFTTTARSPHSRTSTLRKSASAIVLGQSPSAVRATASVRYNPHTIHRRNSG